MKFKNDVFGKLVLGIVFSVFMLVVSLIMMLVVLPVALLPLGVALISPSVATFVGAISSVAILLISFFVIGWAIFYFYKKNTFIYKSR